MATANWIDGGGNWTSASDWSTDAVPGATDDVVISSGDPQVTTNVGTVNSVTISAAGTLTLQNGGKLATTGGVINSGGLDVDTGGTGGSTLTIGGTLTNTNTVVVGDNSVTATLTAQGLSNTGTIYIQGGTGNQALLNIDASAPSTWTGIANISGDGLLEFTGTSGISTIGANAAINLNGADSFVAVAGVGSGSDTGLTGLTTISGQLQLQDGASLTTTGGLTNSGGLYVNNGGSGGSSLAITGTLTNTNTVVVGNNSLATTVTAQGLANSGTIYVQGGPSSQALLNIAANAPATWTGIANISGDGLLKFAGTTGISTIGANAAINLTGVDSFVAVAGVGTGSDTALTGLTTIVGQLLLQDGASLTTSGGLTNSGGLYVNNGGSGGSTLAITGTLTNNNTIEIGNNSLATTVTAQGLANSGTIYIEGGSTNQAFLNITAQNAPSTWTGIANISGDGLLEFAGTTGISTIGNNAQINLTGADSFVAVAGSGTTSDTALTGLTTISGQLLLQDGASLTTSGDLTNSGDLLVNNGGSGGSTLAITGTLINTNAVVVGNNSLATTVTAQGLTNSGTIYIEGGTTSQALLNITAQNAPSTWTGIANISGDGLLEFTGSSGISTIGANAQINLTGTDSFVAAAGVGSGSDTALTGLTTISGQLLLQDGASLTTSGGLTNSGDLLVNNGGSGGSTLGITGTLINTNAVVVGNNSLATTVTAQGLTNSGTIYIEGGTTNQALLNITAQNAPSTWTGIANISGDGLLEFTGSSGISTIGGNAQINLTGTDSFVAAAGVGSGSDTALTGLTTISGQLLLQDGASLTTSGGLTNRGDLLVNNGGSGGSNLTISGTLTNTNTVQVGDNNNNNFATTVAAQGLTNSGTIYILGGTTNQALLNITAQNAPSTWTGIVDVSGDGLLEFTGSSGISTIGTNAQIILNSADSFVAVAGVGTTSDTALTGLTTISGQLQLQNGASLTTSSGLTNSGNLYLDNGGNGGSNLTVSGALVNDNYMQIGLNNVVSAITTLTAQGLSNSNDATIVIEEAAALGDTGSLANSGTIDIFLHGVLTAAGPASDQGTIEVAGAINALDGLTVGSSGHLVLSGGTIGSSDDFALMIAAGGTVSGFGSATLDVTNSGTIEAISGTLDLTSAVNGPGDLAVGSSGTLELGNSAAETVSFGGNVGTLKLDAPSRFTGDITGLAVGDVIDLAGVAATSAEITGTTLIVTTDGSQTFIFSIAGSLAGNSFLIESDGHGGTDVILNSGTSAGQPFDAFDVAVNALDTDLENGAPPGQVPADATNVYITAVAGAIGTVGGALWQQAYQNSGIATGTVASDISSANGSHQLLTDALGLYNTMVAGLIAAIAQSASQQAYSNVVQAAGALGTDIASAAGNSKLLTDLTNLYDALAGGAVSNANWQAAYNASAAAVSTLSTDQANSASSSRILTDVAALYNTIVSGSLNAVGGTGLQQAYENGGQTVLTVGADINNGVAAGQIQRDVAGIYNEVVSNLATTVASDAAIQSYNTLISAANTLDNAIIGNLSGQFAIDAGNILATAFDGPVGANGGAAAQEAFDSFLGTDNQLAVALDEGASSQTLDTIVAPELEGILGPMGDTQWQQLDVALLPDVSAFDTAVAANGIDVADVTQLMLAVISNLVGAAASESPETADNLSTALASLQNAVSGTDSNEIFGSLGAFLSALSSDPPGGNNALTSGAASPGPLTSQQAASNPVDAASTLLGPAMPDAVAALVYLAKPWLAEMAGVGAEGAFLAGFVEALPAIAGFLAIYGAVNIAMQYAAPSDAKNTWNKYFAPNAIGNTLTHPSTLFHGDVHITTFDGLYYNFQAEGEFVLSKSTQPGNSFQIQARLQPWNGSSSVTVMTMIGAEVGADRVTFGLDRTNMVWVNGTPQNSLTVGSSLALNGGTLNELSPNIYQINWNTGESATITNNGSYLDVSMSLGANDGPGSVQGLAGADEGQAYDFQLANGTVLQQPLTTAELYGEYANAWRVTQATSLLDYGAGQTTATFTNVNFPANIVTTSELPQNLVTQAAQIAAADGITDPNILAGAELDYIATGDTSFLTGAANTEQTGGTTTAANVMASTPPPPVVGVNAGTTTVVQQSGLVQNGGLAQPTDPPTNVTFPVYLTSAVSSNTVLDWAVIAPNAGDLGSAAFTSGILPSGEVTISAGQTSGSFTVVVPEGALGSAPTATLEVQLSAPNNPVFASTAQTTIVNSTPTAGPPAVAQLALLTTSVGTLTQNGNNYTLNLGTVVPGEQLPTLQFAVVNAAAVPANSISGTFSAAGAGFGVSGASLPAAILAGQSYNGLDVTVETGVNGANQETITFNPDDVNLTGYSASLSTLTLTITDTANAPALASITSSTVAFPNVRVGTAESQTISVTNSAGSGGAALDASVSPLNGATASGTVNQLAPGNTDSTDLSVGLITSAPGAETGGATVNFYSDAGNGKSSFLQSQAITVSGSVFRPGTASVQGLFGMVGGQTAQALAITNIDPNDGFSEDLIATVVGTSGGVTASGTTGDIAPGATISGIMLGYSTASTGVIGTVTLDFTTDGTGIDGLGTKDLGDETFSVTAFTQLVYVSSGATSAGLGIVSGGLVDVLSGGTASSMAISGGGTDLVNAGGHDFGDRISGEQDVYGVATGVTILAGSQVVEDDGTASDTVVSGGSEIVSAGGTDISGTIDDGAFQYLQSGGAASGTVVNDPGIQVVSAGADVISAVLNGGVQNVYGSAIGTTVNNGGVETITSGGTAFDTFVSNGGTGDVGPGGTAFGMTDFAGGVDSVGSGGVAAGTVVSNGGTEYVLSGGTASDSFLSGGGQDISFAGLAIGTTVSSGGYQLDYGTASGTTLASSGLQLVFGADVGATVSGGGLQGVAAGAAATGTTVSSGGVQFVYGTASSVTLDGGAEEVILAGGVASDTTELSGGLVYVGAGGEAAGGTVSSGAVLYDYGSTTGMTVGGTAYILGTDASAAIGSGGVEEVFSGAAISSAVISGGELELKNGATAGDTAITFASNGSGGDGGVLKIDGTGAFNFLVAGFGVPDEIDLSGVNFATATKSYSGNTSSGTLTVTDGTHSVSILLLGNYSAASFDLNPDGGTGTLITDPPVGAPMSDLAPVGLVTPHHA